MAAPQIAFAPPEGVWRIGRGPTPLATRRPPPLSLTVSPSGNRFDSPSGSFGVLYFGSSLEGCYGETLARFRPSPAVIAAVGDEWANLNFMDFGAVPAEWRQRRSAVKVTLPPESIFLDVEAAETQQYLRDELAGGLAALGHSDLDVSTVRGPDRRVTRMIAEWTAVQSDEDGNPYYAGMLSRLNTEWECWAVSMTSTSS